MNLMLAMGPSTLASTKEEATGGAPPGRDSRKLRKASSPPLLRTLKKLSASAMAAHGCAAATSDTAATSDRRRPTGIVCAVMRASCAPPGVAPHQGAGAHTRGE